jgi:hypothetical protein
MDSKRGLVIIPMLIWTVIVLIASLAMATDITTCGATIAAGDTGVLQADLDCSTSPIGVLVLSGGVLDLNGHSIAGGDGTTATVLGARNSDGSGRANFRIVGPGEIAGTSRNYNTSSGTGTCVQVNDGLVKMSGGTGSIDIHGCIYGITGSTAAEANGLARVFLDHVHLHDLLYDGVGVATLIASEVVATNNGGQGLGAANTLKALNVVATNNVHGHGLFAGTNLKGVNVTSTDNYSGAEAWRTLKLANAQVIGNTFSGVAGTRVQLSDSTVTGNGFVDVLSRTRPVLKNTTCNRSLDFNDMSWGVCANGSPSGAFL